MKAQCAERTLEAVGRLIGMSPSSVWRICMCRQSVTLRSFYHILDRLHCTPDDVFHPNGSNGKLPAKELARL